MSCAYKYMYMYLIGYPNFNANLLNGVNRFVQNIQLVLRITLFHKITLFHAY